MKLHDGASNDLKLLIDKINKRNKNMNKDNHDGGQHTYASIQEARNDNWLTPKEFLFDPNYRIITDNYVIYIETLPNEFYESYVVKSKIIDLLTNDFLYDNEMSDFLGYVGLECSEMVLIENEHQHFSLPCIQKSTCEAEMDLAVKQTESMLDALQPEHVYPLVVKSKDHAHRCGWIPLIQYSNIVYVSQRYQIFIELKSDNIWYVVCSQIDSDHTSNNLKIYPIKKYDILIDNVMTVCGHIDNMSKLYESAKAFLLEIESSE